MQEIMIGHQEIQDCSIVCLEAQSINSLENTEKCKNTWIKPKQQLVVNLN